MTLQFHPGVPQLSTHSGQSVVPVSGSDTPRKPGSMAPFPTSFARVTWLIQPSTQNGASRV